MGVHIFLSEISSYFWFFVTASSPCHGNVPYTLFFNIHTLGCSVFFILFVVKVSSSSGHSIALSQETYQIGTLNSNIESFKTMIFDLTGKYKTVKFRIYIKKKSRLFACQSSNIQYFWEEKKSFSVQYFGYSAWIETLFS